MLHINNWLSLSAFCDHYSWNSLHKKPFYIRQFIFHCNSIPEVFIWALDGYQFSSLNMFLKTYTQEYKPPSVSEALLVAVGIRWSRIYSMFETCWSVCVHSLFCSVVVLQALSEARQVTENEHSNLFNDKLE